MPLAASVAKKARNGRTMARNELPAAAGSSGLIAGSTEESFRIGRPMGRLTGRMTARLSRATPAPRTRHTRWAAGYRVRPRPTTEQGLRLPELGRLVRLPGSRIYLRWVEHPESAAQTGSWACPPEAQE